MQDQLFITDINDPRLRTNMETNFKHWHPSLQKTGSLLIRCERRLRGYVVLVLLDDPRIY